MGHFFLFIIWLLPALIVLCSKRVHGGDKLIWALLSAVLSWPALLVFMVVTTLRNPLPTSRMK